jgi:hypothetical protein
MPFTATYQIASSSRRRRRMSAIAPGVPASKAMPPAAAIAGDPSPDGLMARESLDQRSLAAGHRSNDEADSRGHADSPRVVWVALA